jgi:hypothetical protein
MEWGPRALGNRSIVCDPRRADIEAILNAKIKRRESFRPFAPSVLEDAVADWFESSNSGVRRGRARRSCLCPYGQNRQGRRRHQPDIAVADHSDAHVAPFVHP